VDVSATTWWVTIGAMVVFLVIDVGIIARRHLDLVALGQPVRR
jgi:hypothetical protein